MKNPSPLSSTPIHVRALVKRFGRRVVLNDVDFEVGAGEIVGLVGPNGSGKTTLLKILSGFVRSDGGCATVFGLLPEREQTSIMERARFAFAPPALFDALTPWEHLRHLTALRSRRMPRVQTGDLERVLDQVGLGERRHDRVRTFSLGMRQRLALALAIVPVPELLVLDEPSDGLDPVAVYELRGVLHRLRDEQGVAILLSSHLLSEIELLVDRVLVLVEGRTLFWGAPAEMIDGAGALRLETSSAARAVELLRARGLAADVLDERCLELPVGAIDLDTARAVLAGGGLVLEGFGRRHASFEQALFERLRPAAAENGLP